MVWWGKRGLVRLFHAAVFAYEHDGKPGQLTRHPPCRAGACAAPSAYSGMGKNVDIFNASPGIACKHKSKIKGIIFNSISSSTLPSKAKKKDEKRLLEKRCSLLPDVLLPLVCMYSSTVDHHTILVTGLYVGVRCSCSSSVLCVGGYSRRASISYSYKPSSSVVGALRRCGRYVS